MSKLRLVKPDHNLDIEYELGLLGRSELFEDLAPEPVLTVFGDWEQHSEVLKQLDAIPDAEIRGVAGHTHFRCVAPDFSHKEKALNLFAAAYLLRSSGKATVHLWQHNKLTHVLNERMSDKTVAVAGPKTEQVVGFSAEPTIRIYLHQAGVDVHCKIDSDIIDESRLKHSFAPAEQKTLRRVG